MNRKIVIFAVIGIISLLFLLKETRKSNFSVTYNRLRDEEFITKPTRQGSESISEHYLPTEHSKSANLTDANLTDEENLDTPVGHRRICEILLNESGSVYSSDYLEDCVSLVDSHPRLYEFLLKAKHYITWHRKRVEEISKSKKGISHERILVGTCINPYCGGYGSQMTCLGFAFVLAVATERLLLLKWPESQALRRQLQEVRLDIFSPKTFDWSAFDNDINIDEIPISKTTDLCSEVQSQKTVVVYDIEGWAYKKEDCARRLGYAEIGTWNFGKIRRSRSGTNFNVNPLFIITRLLFQFGEPVRKFEQKFWELQGLNGSESIDYAAVHIRTGSFGSGLVENEKTKRFISTKEKWKKQIEYALKIKEENHIKAPLFLATDLTDCKDWAKETYKDKIITMDIIPIHIIKDTHGQSVEKSKKTPEKYKEEIVHTVADIALMAHAKVLIASDSLFSMLSSYLGDLSSKQIYQYRF